MPGQHTICCLKLCVVPKRDLQQRPSTLGVTVIDDLVCCDEVLFVTNVLVP